MDLRIATRKSGSVNIVDLRGRMVIGPNSDAFRIELRELSEDKPCDVLVNLGEVTQMDSSGISALVQSFVTLKRDGGSLKLLNPTKYVRTILEVTGLVNCVPIYTDEATALASFRNSAAHA